MIQRDDPNEEVRVIGDPNLVSGPNGEEPASDRHVARAAALAPSVIRILVVTDGAGGYNRSEFTLSILVKILQEYSDPKVKFTVKKAHRSVAAGADINDFRFHHADKFCPADYEEVWLFGVSRGGAAGLEEEELTILWRFMGDGEGGGKGVFATGDHEDIGSPLCGNIPRVRSMRRWNGPKAPPRNNEFRHDSLRKGYDHIYNSRDERDDVPQVIFPKIYSMLPPEDKISACCPRVYPHPLLCGDDRILRFMPDHMHEGVCYEPLDCEMEETRYYDGSNHLEFPFLPKEKKERLRPEVIAFARTTEPHVTFDPKEELCLPATQVSSFGAIGIYDGHRVGVGRVAVDSSFHHFFDMNLSGYESSTDFTSPDKGRKAYDQIKLYFRNIALWLAPKPFQTSLQKSTFLQARFTYPLSEELLGTEDGIDFDSMSDDYLVHLGRMVRGTIAEVAPPCLSWEWSLDLIRDLQPVRDIQLERKFLPDPWIPKDSANPNQAQANYTELFLEIVLGAVMLYIAAEFTGTEEDRAEKAANKLSAILQEATLGGTDRFLKLMRTHRTALNHFIKDCSGTFSSLTGLSEKQ